MALTTREVAVLGVLLCCVPIQLWLTHVSHISRELRTIKLQETILSYHLMFDNWISPSTYISWFKELQDKFFVKDYNRWYPDDADPLGQCPAVEVAKLQDPNGYFATSMMPRSKRPVNVKLRVGQVVQHTIHGYLGVIIGWDNVCKAPTDWIQTMHKDNKDWQNEPNYAVLVDVRHRSLQKTYVVQRNLRIVKTKINHPKIDNYFGFYDGAQYILQPWLRAVYPMD